MLKKFDSNFKRVLASQVISLFGGNVLQFALIIFISHASSNMAFSIILALAMSPPIFFTPLGGVLADRFHKKALIILLDAAKALVCFLMFIVFLSDDVSLILLSALMFVAMTIMALFAPVLTAALPFLVHKDHLMEANGAMQTINGSAFVIGSIIAAILTPLIGTANIILGCGVLFCISVVIDRFIRVPFVRRRTQGNFGQVLVGDLKESWHYLKSENPKILRLAFITAILFALFQPAVVQITPIVTELLSGTENYIAIANAVVGTGAIGGALLVGSLKRWLRPRFLSQMIILAGIGLIIMALSLHPATLSTGFWAPFWIFSISLSASQGVLTLASITFSTVMQKETPADLLGKVSALSRTISSITTPIGVLLFGIVLSLSGEQFDTAFFIVAIVTLVLAVVTKMMFRSSSK